MKRNIKQTMAAVGVMMVVAGGGIAAPAGAASPSQTQCEASGGTFTKTNGTASCTIVTVDPVGNSESSPQDKSQTRDTTTSDSEQGNITPKDKNAPTSTCTGPGNSNNC